MTASISLPAFGFAAFGFAAGFLVISAWLEADRRRLHLKRRVHHFGEDRFARPHGNAYLLQ